MRAVVDARAPGAAALLLVLLASACGTLAPDGNPVGVLPSSGAGPYRALDEPSPLLSEPTASLDDPFLVAGEAGGGFTVYFTRRADDGTVDIARARFASLADRPLIERVLAADAAWEGGAIQQPALHQLGGGRTALLYAAASGAIGCALSDEAGRFTKLPGPLRVAAPGAGPLWSPALLAPEGGGVRLLFLDGVTTAARLMALDVDAAGAAALAAGDPAAVAGAVAAEVPRGEALAPGIGRFTARTVLLSTGRQRFDLFLTRPATPRSLAFAASYDGARFSAAAAPLLPAANPEEWSPAVAPAGDGGTLLVYGTGQGRRGVLSVARAP